MSNPAAAGKPHQMATRPMTYAGALNDAMDQALSADPGVMVYGIGADGAGGIFGTTKGLAERHGGNRVFDVPIAEQALTGLAGGAANAGLRPVLVHQRLDFMLYGVDMLVNWLSMWRFISGGQAKLPLTIRAIVGKGWGQGPQHSKSLHAWFAHVPGLQVVMPATPADAKGLLLASIFSDDPTLVIEGRQLYAMTEEVPVAPYRLRLGKAAVRRAGTDATIVAIGAMVPEALAAAERLDRAGRSVEVVDLRCLAPLDIDTVIASVRHTGRLVVADPGWQRFGASAEIVAAVAEALGPDMKARPKRVTWPNGHSPTSAHLESAFYPGAAEIEAACRAVIEGSDA
ncbi:MAG: transketolase C-terminal domain-containing protein [Sneathiellaceae bacterium]